MLNINDYVKDWPDLPYSNFTQALEGQCSKWGSKPLTLYRSGHEKDFHQKSYAAFGEDCRRIGRGLVAAGLKRGDRVALWAENRPEWMEVWMGAVAAGFVVVPMDFMASDEEALNILKTTAAAGFFYSDRKAAFAASAGVKELGSIRAASSLGALDSFGKDADSAALPAPDDIPGDAPASIVFTSGTTGFAKGVVLSHKGIIANSSAAIRQLYPESPDVFFAPLPLHHTYPTMTTFISPFMQGITIVIPERLVPEILMRDIKDGGVTYLIAVPLLFDKMRKAMEEALGKLPGWQKAFLKILRKHALSQAQKGKPGFGQKRLRFVREQAGMGKVKMCVAGGGALNPQTADFFESLGFNLVQGYGMSENGPLVAVNVPSHKKNTSVGLPVLYTDVKILDEAGKELPIGETGEIAVKSPSLMLGYYNDEAATRAMFNADGFLLTGDLGFQDEDGFISINGRKKNLIVSAGGKNIYPEEIEAHFADSRVIGEILVLGRKTKAGEIIYAVIVPNTEALKADYPGRESDTEFVRGLIKNEIETVNRTLPSYKKIADWTLRTDPFEKNAQEKIRRFLYKDYEHE
jgi:long-chain acyl-CoA synthetase